MDEENALLFDLAASTFPESADVIRWKMPPVPKKLCESLMHPFNFDPGKNRRWFRPTAGVFLALVLFALPTSFGCGYVAPQEPAPPAPPKASVPEKDPAVTAQKETPKEVLKDPPILRRVKPADKKGKRSDQPKEFWVKVLRVIDGVTFSLETNNVVCLIGVAPPRHSMGKAYREFFDRVTTPAVRKIVEGKRVSLMRDKVFQGLDGQPIIYLFLKDKTMLNATLIQKGYARVTLEVPFKFQDEFRLWERDAQDIGLGLWARIGN